MEFRWIAALTLWTLLIGPVMDAPWGDANAKARSQGSRTARSR